MNFKQVIKKVVNHSLAKNSAIVFIGSMTANFSAYLYHLVAGRVLGPERYGDLAALLSLFYILNVPSSVLQTVLVKFFSSFKAKSQYGQAKSLFFAATKNVIVGAVIIFLIVIWFLSYIADFLHIASPSYLVWLYVIFATYFLSTVNASTMQGFQLFLPSVIYSNIGMLLRLLIGGGLAFWGVGWALVGNVISNALTYFAMFIPIRFLLTRKSEKLELPRSHVVNFSAPTLFATLGMVMLYSFDVVLVKHFFSGGEAGIYSSLSILGKIIFFASSSVTFVIYPVIAERRVQKKNNHTIVWLSLGCVGLISAVLTAFYFAFPVFVINLLFGQAYMGAVSLVGVFGLFITFYSLSSILTTICVASEKMNVWILNVLASISQIILINMFHTSLYAVITVNMIVCGILFVSLLAYYHYAAPKPIS